jgi:hypothetical protein
LKFDKDRAGRTNKQQGGFLKIPFDSNHVHQEWRWKSLLAALETKRTNDPMQLKEEVQEQSQIAAY